MPEQYLVPQFIDVEDKIIGPITVRQFAIMMAALVFGAILYKLLAFMVFLPAAIIEVGIGAIFSFARVNGRPIHFFLLNFAQTMKRPSARVWDKSSYMNVMTEVRETGSLLHEEPRTKTMITGSHLEDLALVINTGGLYQVDEEDYHAVFDINKEAQDVK
jgi:hypothetical protein